MYSFFLQSLDNRTLNSKSFLADSADLFARHGLPGKPHLQTERGSRVTQPDSAESHRDTPIPIAFARLQVQMNSRPGDRNRRDVASTAAAFAVDIPICKEF